LNYTLLHIHLKSIRNNSYSNNMIASVFCAMQPEWFISVPIKREGHCTNPRKDLSMCIRTKIGLNFWTFYFFSHQESCDFGSTILRVQNIIMVDCCDRKRGKYLKLICMRRGAYVLRRHNSCCWYNYGC